MRNALPHRLSGGGCVFQVVHREGITVTAAGTQFKLVKDMEDKWEEMQRIVEKYM